MRAITLTLSILAITLRLVSASDGGITDCALPCVANVADSNCTASNWPCLCANGPWVDQTNTCVQNSCNAAEQEASYLAFAQICNIFNVTLTASPEATFPATALSVFASSSLSALGGPGPASVTALPSITPAVSPMETSATSSSNTADSTLTSTTSPAAATATALAGSGNGGARTRETEVWFGLAVLLLAGAAIL
jgi:CFEM-containing surface protein